MTSVGGDGSLPKMSLRLPTNLRPGDFVRLLRSFGVDAGSAQLLGASQNFVYLAARQGREVIVRISTQRHRTREEIDGELQWILLLAEHGLPVCPPLRSAAGAPCEILEIQGQVFLTAVFPKAPGRKPERADLTEAFCSNVGRLIGRLHQAAREATSSGVRLRRRLWSSSRLLTEDFDTSPAPLGNRFRSGVSALVAEIGKRPAVPSHFGLLHGDVNMGNLHLQEDGRLWIFDFDNCEYGFFLQDLATLLYDSIYSKVVKHVLPDELTATVGRFWDGLLCGYREIGGALPFESEDLFRFFLLREAILYVHYHRILPREMWSDPFLVEMGRHVEAGWHPLAIGKLTF